MRNCGEHWTICPLVSETSDIHPSISRFCCSDFTLGDYPLEERGPYIHTLVAERCQQPSVAVSTT